MENRTCGRRSCMKRNEIWIENRTPGRRSCRETRSGWKMGRRSCRETRSGWKIEGLEGVVAEKLDLDGK